MADAAALLAEIERLYHRQADLRAYELDLAERGESDPASDTWKTAAIIAASAEADFQSALVRNWPPISRVLREAADGWRPISEATGSEPILGIQTTPGDNENMVGTCRPYDANGTKIWIGLGGLMPTHWRPLPTPPSENGNG